MSWAAIGMIVVGGVSVAHDVVVLMAAGQPMRVVAGTALTTAALCTLWAAVLSPVAALAAALAQRRVWAQYAAVGLAMSGLAWWILDPTRRLGTGVYVGFAVLSGCAGLGLVWLRRQPEAWNRKSVLLVAAVAWWVHHGLLTPTTYLELHSLAQLLWVCALVAASVDLRLRWGQNRSRWRETATVAAVAIAILVTLVVDGIAPRWRVVASSHTVSVNGYLRAARSMVDLDRDGYSSIAWGSDCDDFDSSRHPRALDLPGDGDANCNGIDPPANPSDADRGLTASFGDPVAEVDRIVLITVDTLRADAFRAELMPRTWAYASTGIRFERMYAISPATIVSMPVLVGAQGPHPSAADELRRAKVGLSAIADGAANAVRASLGEVSVKEVTSARRVTEKALETLASLPSGKQFVWVHYFDPHSPYSAPEATVVPDVATHLPASYRQEVAYADRWLGELFDGIGKLGLADRTMVVFTSDHGEAFGEYGQVHHGRGGFDPVLRVPAFIVGPGVPAGVHPHLVSHRDIAPTLLGAAGLTPPERFGRSWLRLRQAPTDALHTFVVARSARYVSGREVDVPLGVLVKGHHKLIVDLDNDLAMLYDLRSANGEATDVASDHRALWREYERLLNVYLDLDMFPTHVQGL